MAQLIIVTTPQNSGDGTPLATAFNYCNSNFGELYSRFQVNPPATLVGSPGDQPGFYASDSNYFYYCYSPFDGSSVIWARVTQVGNIALPEIQAGTSNIQIAQNNGNATVSIGGVSNVAVFAINAFKTTTPISAAGNISGDFFIGNGSQLTGLPATYTDSNVVTLLSSFGNNSISTTGNINASVITGAGIQSLGTISAIGNVTGNCFIGNGSQLTNLPILYNNSNVATFLQSFGSNSISTTGTISSGNITGGNIQTGGLISATSNVAGGNITTTGNIFSQGKVSAVGNIETSGYFVGTFVGNVTGNFVVPGSNTQVIFNTSGNADAVGGFTYNKGSNTLTVLGVISSQGNVIGGNLLTSGLLTAGQISASGNIIGGNISVTGALTAGSYSTNGNVTGGNIRTSGIISATGSLSTSSISSVGNIVTGGNILGNGNISTTGDINTTANVSASTYYGIQASVTGSLSASIVNSNTISGNSIVSTGNVTGSNIYGTISSPSQPLISSVGNLTSLSVLGNINAANIRTTGQVTATGNVTGGNVIVQNNINIGGNVSATNYTGVNLSLTGSATASSLTITGNVTAGNISGNITTGGSLSTTGNITGNYLFGNGSQLTGLPSTYGNSEVASFLATFGSNSISTTGTVTSNTFVGNSIVVTSATMVGNILSTGNIFSNNIIGSTLSATGTLINSGLSTTGNIISGNISTGTIIATGITVGLGNITVGNILTGGNIISNIGSLTNQFNTIFAKATSAQYADLAEKYLADAEYAPGTVVIFGGDQEITVTSELADERVAGAISTEPAYLMNSQELGLAVALRGKVPVKVVGPVAKGDSLVTSTTPGVAVSVGRDRTYGQAVFAKALESSNDTSERVILAVII